jgi:hypothetical protein
MKNKAHFLVILALVFPFAVTGKAQQDIPPGVKYKPAPDPVNAAAKLKLEGALANGAAFPGELFGENLIWCGPTLWKSLKPSADKTLLEAQKLLDNIPLSDGVISVEGRGMRNEQEQRSFWKALMAKYPSLQTGRVRKATPREIRYFWATTVFDIDEPFFAIDAGSQTFVVHMGREHDIYTFDLVGDLRDLRGASVQQEYTSPVTGEVYHADNWVTYSPKRGASPAPQRVSVSAGKIVLLTGDQDLRARITVEDLADYLKAIENAVDTFFTPAERRAQRELTIQFTLMPEGNKIQFAAVPDLRADVARQLLTQLESVPAPKVGGQVKLEYILSVWGAAAKQ